MTKPALDPTWLLLCGSLAAFVPRVSMGLPGTYLWFMRHSGQYKIACCEWYKRQCRLHSNSKATGAGFQRWVNKQPQGTQTWLAEAHFDTLADEESKRVMNELQEQAGIKPWTDAASVNRLFVSQTLAREKPSFLCHAFHIATAGYGSFPIQ